MRHKPALEVGDILRIEPVAIDRRELPHERHDGHVGQPPPLTVVLPADPRVRDLRVTPHALAPYDALLTPPTPPEEVPDAPTA